MTIQEPPKTVINSKNTNVYTGCNQTISEA